MESQISTVGNAMKLAHPPVQQGRSVWRAQALMPLGSQGWAPVGVSPLVVLANLLQVQHALRLQVQTYNRSPLAMLDMISQ